MSDGRDSSREVVPSESRGAQETPAGDTDRPATPPPEQIDAATIGRYAILKLLGEGGMGSVYAVYDDRLDRRIALKLVKRGGSREAQRRMLREAQALAKVGHPNVVAVFEVGEHEGQLFVAMEYVDGMNLERWRAAKERSVRDVLGVYLQAGHGLAAVHAQGLIHRDFKPANAVVGEDARVRVLDFGLATRHGLEPAPERTLVPRDGALDAALTQTGAVLGTPAYMPPEQFRSDTVDARSDQFSFCVALWEAVYGTRPFTGATRPALFHAISRGSITEPGRANVPAALRPILERGLQPRPEDRWPDMATLLAALQRLYGTPRGRVLRWGALGVVVAGAALAYGFARQRGDLDDMLGRVEASERVAAQEQTKAELATQDKDEALVAMHNALLISRAVLLENAPTEAAAMLREVSGPDPHAIFGWDDTAQPVRLQSRPLRAVLRGHTDHLERAWFHGDEHVITASPDGTVRVFDADGRGSPRTLPGHEGSLVSAALSRDGTHVATGSMEGVVRVLRTDGSGAPRVFEGHRGAVLDLEFSPAGDRVVSGSIDGTARIVDVEGARATVVLSGHTLPVGSAAFDADGARVVTASWDRTARVFDADGRRTPVVLSGHSQDLVQAAFSPDGSRVVTGSMDETARIFDADGTGRATILPGHAGDVGTVLFSSDGTRVVTGSFDGSVRIFPSDGSGDPVVLDYGVVPRSIAFSPDGERLVVGGDDGKARVVDVDAERPALVLGGHSQAVLHAAWSDDGQRVVTASKDKTARVYSATEPAPVLLLSGHTDSVKSAAFSPDGTRIATASFDRTVRVWNVDGTGDAVVLKGHAGRVVSVEFSPDGEHILTASWDQTARIFAADGTGEARLLLRHSTKVNRARWSPDGERIVVAASDNTARILDVDGTGDPMVIADHDDAVIDAAFSPDGTRIATASRDNMARVFSVEGGDALVAFPHPQHVYAVAFSPDGTRIVTAGRDKIARIFHIEGAGEPVRLEGADALVWDAEFSPDGRFVVVASRDSTAILHRADGGGVPTVLGTGGEAVFSAVFSPDGRRIATTSENGHTRIYATDMLVQDLRTSLWRTPFCHSPLQRTQLLAEPEAVARARHQRCLDLVKTCTTQPFDTCHAEVTRLFGE